MTLARADPRLVIVVVRAPHISEVVRARRRAAPEPDQMTGNRRPDVEAPDLIKRHEFCIASDLRGPEAIPGRRVGGEDEFDASGTPLRITDLVNEEAMTDRDPEPCLLCCFPDSARLHRLARSRVASGKDPGTTIGSAT